MSEYEFSSEQNRTIRNVSSRVMWQGVLLALGGVFGLIADFLKKDTLTTSDFIVTVAQSALFVVMGVLILRPSDNFKRITTTVGKDVKELMSGFKELNFATVLSIVFLILIIAGDVVGILF